VKIPENRTISTVTTVEEPELTSGLTPVDVRLVPVLFGSRDIQNALLEIASNGSLPYEKLFGYHRRLVVSGICKVFEDRGQTKIAIDRAYPAIDELCMVLSELLGKPVFVEPKTANTGKIDQGKPLAHASIMDFRVILVFVQAKEKIETDSVKERIRDKWPQQVDEAIQRLLNDEVLGRGEGRYLSLCPSISQSFYTYVLKIADVIADPRLMPSEAVARKAAYLQADDGAPRFFGTDLRLRNLMALAVYGPMHVLDLRKITGAYSNGVESPNNAPFGRGDIVRVWQTKEGTAVGLDQQYPLYLPLHRFLVKLAEIYPLALHIPKHGIPEPPPRQAWSGERLALFGSAMPTSILICLCLPSHWTFEAICCEVATGFYREVIKKRIRRLEDEGVIQGSRPRGPGFGPRLLSLADTCPAREELQALIDAVPIAWPDLGERVQAAMDGIPDKTKEYFRRRALWD